MRHTFRPIHSEATDHGIAFGLFFTLKRGGTMKEATYDDAIEISRKLNLNKEYVWEIIKGMKYNTLNDLAIAVHKALAL
jgi:hypothetical protein